MTDNLSVPTSFYKIDRQNYRQEGRYLHLALTLDTDTACSSSNKLTAGKLWPLSGLSRLSPLVILIAPRASLVLLGVTALVALVATLSDNHATKIAFGQTAATPIVVAGAAFLCWSFLSSVWSVDPTRSIEQPSLITLVFISAIGAIGGIRIRDKGDTWYLARGMICGFLYRCCISHH